MGLLVYLNDFPMIRTLPCIVVFIFFYVLSNAQDIHFSQFYNAPVNINPALTGSFVGDTRYVANYRNQWRQVPVNYLTFAGTYDTKLKNNFIKFGDLAVGGHFHYDIAGDSKLYNTQLSAIASLSKKLNERNRLALGLSAGITALGFDYDDLRFNSQFDGEVFNPDLASGEELLDAKNNIIYPDLTVGVNWSHRVKNTRSYFNVGLAAVHFNAPKTNFYENRIDRIDARFNVFIDGAIQVHRRLDIHARTLAQRTGPESEFLIGLAGRFYLDPHLLNESAIELGVNYRFFDLGDAWSPTIEFHHRAITVGLSYDINVSDFDIATNNRGGLEIAIIYRTARTPDGKPKDCKIF